MKNRINEYAKLLVEIGVCIEHGDTLYLNCPVDMASFGRLVAKAAYERDAKEVVINWMDDETARMKYLYADESVFSEFPQWMVDRSMYYAEGQSAYLSIAASDPDLYAGVDPKRLATFSRTAGTALEKSSELRMKQKWCVASIPSEAWAKKVFPNSTNPVDDLWEAIFKTTRMDQENPVQAWINHSNTLKERTTKLNDYNFKSLHYKNSLGTDVVVELIDNHAWLGGSDDADRARFANIPTEEVFTMPTKTGVNGRICSALPLSYNGTLIDEFWMEFKDGKCVDCGAKQGEEVLKDMITADEGASHLGEVALVPYHSPISMSGILFYNTLFDENASCHFAFGRAYTDCFKDEKDIDRDEMIRRGMNTSIIHVDFMVGNKDLEIIGTTHDGQQIQVFKNGDFAF